MHLMKFLRVLALKCPPRKEYQACVNTCKTRTCQNRDYYEETTCSSIREECVCKSGTILHRADSAFCVTEEQCGENALTKPIKQTAFVTRVFMLFTCDQFVRIMRVLRGLLERCGTVLCEAAACSSVWRTAAWCLWNPSAVMNPCRCVRERESMQSTCWRKEYAAQRRSVVYRNKNRD